MSEKHFEHVCSMIPAPEDGMHMKGRAVDLINTLVKVEEETPKFRSRSQYDKIDLNQLVDDSERETLVSFCFRQFQDGLNVFDARLILEKALETIGLCPSLEKYLKPGIVTVLRLLFADMEGGVKYSTISEDDGDKWRLQWHAMAGAFTFDTVD